MSEEEIAAKFNERLAVYRAKRDRADPFAEESYTAHEALRYVIEAIEILARECRLTDRVSVTPDVKPRRFGAWNP